MPIGTEAFCLQSSDTTLGQVTVLKAAARQDNPRLAYPLRDRDDGFGKGVVEPGGDEGDGEAAV